MVCFLYANDVVIVLHHFILCRRRCRRHPRPRPGKVRMVRQRFIIAVVEIVAEILPY